MEPMDVNEEHKDHEAKLLSGLAQVEPLSLDPPLPFSLSWADANYPVPFS